MSQRRADVKERTRKQQVINVSAPFPEFLLPARRALSPVAAVSLALFGLPQPPQVCWIDKTPRAAATAKSATGGTGARLCSSSVTQMETTPSDIKWRPSGPEVSESLLLASCATHSRCGSLAMISAAGRRRLEQQRKSRATLAGRPAGAQTGQ